MKLLVCISKTPETTAKISFTEDNTAFSKEGVQFIMNPYDEWFALVRAIELKEKHGGTVTVINVGTPDNDIVIRKALAIGADDAVRVNADPASANFTAHQVAHYAQDKDFDIIFAGKETIDFNGSLVGPMVAELLDLPFFSYASHLEVEGDTKTITCDVEGGIEVLECSAPCVISATKGLAQQRIPNMRGIMMAKRKPLEVVEPVDVSETEKITHLAHPEGKSGVKMVDPENMEELVRLLHEEAKVI